MSKPSKGNKSQVPLVSMSGGSSSASSAQDLAASLMDNEEEEAEMELAAGRAPVADVRAAAAHARAPVVDLRVPAADAGIAPWLILQQSSNKPPLLKGISVDELKKFKEDYDAYIMRCPPGEEWRQHPSTFVIPAILSVIARRASVTIEVLRASTENVFWKRALSVHNARSVTQWYDMVEKCQMDGGNLSFGSLVKYSTDFEFYVEAAGKSQEFFPSEKDIVKTFCKGLRPTYVA